MSPRKGIDLLRLAVRLCDNSGREAFYLMFTAEELLKLASAWDMCEHDIPPHMWTGEQIDGALVGIVPTFEE